ncbi:MAG: recombinase family protein [Afipia sp.]|nr:recombinase family protein [Afipia sp.]
MADRSTQVRTFRCAIYTRKSSEEGLEQDFNSLHAQRESCDAYIKSQKHEGWTALPRHYDDGGYSGGSIERPALRALLADIEAHKIDVVIVYKVDRLTRSLADFAKIVEVFDAAGVSFVSVTQQFNTTTSMGRLTLNVLLSFAQFEREVTGERIRDKIAASKQKGMWMGGWVPIGYDRKDRTLTINESEATTVRAIFDLYLKLGSVMSVKAELDRLKLTTKRYVAETGRQMGGLTFARGHLYKMLSNPLYIGVIEHKGKRHPGLHPPLIDREQWDEVQALLQRKRQSNQTREYAKSASLLAGLIFDENGRRMISTHTQKNGKRYRYYITTDGNGRAEADQKKVRLPASAIDKLIRTKLSAYLLDANHLVRLLRRCRLGPDAIERGIEGAAKLASALTDAEKTSLGIVHDLVSRIDARSDRADISLNLDKLIQRLVGPMETAGTNRIANEIISVSISDIVISGAAEKLIVHTSLSEPKNERGLKAYARGYSWFEELTSGQVSSIVEIARREKLTERYVSRTIHLAISF